MLFVKDKVKIALWPDNCSMALSFSFDDVEPSHYQNIAPLLEQFGVRGTFFINAGLLEIESVNGYKQVLAHGHELGNHTYEHVKLKDCSPEMVQFQVRRGHDAIFEIFGVEATAFCHTHNRTNRLIDQYVFDSYDISRIVAKIKTNRFYSDIRSYTPIQLMDETFKMVLKKKGWWHVAGHGMCGSGWEPVSKEFLSEVLLRYLQPYVHVGTVSSVGVYELLRSSVKMDWFWSEQEVRFSFDWIKKFEVFEKVEVLPLTILVEAPKKGMLHILDPLISLSFQPNENLYIMTVDLKKQMSYQFQVDFPWKQKLKG